PQPRMPRARSSSAWRSRRTAPRFSGCYGNCARTICAARPLPPAPAHEAVGQRLGRHGNHLSNFPRHGPFAAKIADVTPTIPGLAYVDESDRRSGKTCHPLACQALLQGYLPMKKTVSLIAAGFALGACVTAQAQTTWDLPSAYPA